MRGGPTGPINRTRCGAMRRRGSCATKDHMQWWSDRVVQDSITRQNDRFKLYSGLARIDVEQCQEWVSPIRERSFASLLLPNYLHNGRHILLSMYINISPNKGISTGYLEVKSE